MKVEKSTQTPDELRQLAAAEEMVEAFVSEGDFAGEEASLSLAAHLAHDFPLDAPGWAGGTVAGLSRGAVLPRSGADVEAVLAVARVEAAHGDLRALLLAGAVGVHLARRGQRSLRPGGGVSPRDDRDGLGDVLAGACGRSRGCLRGRDSRPEPRCPPPVAFASPPCAAANELTQARTFGRARVR